MRRLYLLVWMGWLLWWLAPGHAGAQCQQIGSFTGGMRLMNGAGCAPLRVEAKLNLANARNVRYVFDYDGRNESRQTTDSVFTYTKPGVYQILQLGEQDGRPTRICARVLVYDTIPPRVTLQACGRTARIQIFPPTASSIEQQELLRYDWFDVDWGDGQRDTTSRRPLRLSHTYASNTLRTIRVKGVHFYGRCGGTTLQAFTPATAGQRVGVAQAERNGSDVVLRLDNPASLPLTVQRQTSAGQFENVAQTSRSSLTLPNQPLGEVCYRVLPADTCLLAQPSAPICTQPPVLPPAPGATWYVPSAFTPNADGVNDTFLPVGFPLAETYRITVYDRMGRALWTTDNSQMGWDALSGGRPLPTGVYAWRLDWQPPGQPPQTLRGSVQLIR